MLVDDRSKPEAAQSCEDEPSFLQSIHDEVSVSIEDAKAAERQQRADELKAFEESLAEGEAERQEADEQQDKEAGQYSIATHEGLVECVKTFMATTAYLEAADPMKEITAKQVASHVAMLCGVGGPDLKPWLKDNQTKVAVRFKALIQGTDVMMSSATADVVAATEDGCVEHDYDAGNLNDGSDARLPKRLRDSGDWVEITAATEAKLYQTLDANIWLDTSDHLLRLSTKAELDNPSDSSMPPPLVGLEVRLRKEKQTPYILLFFPSHIQPSGDLLQAKEQIDEVLCLRLQDDRGGDFKAGQEVVDECEKWTCKKVKGSAEAYFKLSEPAWPADILGYSTKVPSQAKMAAVAEWLANAFDTVPYVAAYRMQSLEANLIMGGGDGGLQEALFASGEGAAAYHDLRSTAQWTAPRCAPLLLRASSYAAHTRFLRDGQRRDEPPLKDQQSQKVQWACRLVLSVHPQLSNSGKLLADTPQLHFSSRKTTSESQGNNEDTPSSRHDSKKQRDSDHEPVPFPSLDQPDGPAAKKIQVLEAKVKDLDSKLELKAKENERLATTNRDQGQKINRMNTADNRTSAARDKLQSEVATLKARVKELEHVESELAALKGSPQLRQKNVKTSQEYKDLNDELTSANAEIEKLKKKASKAEGEGASKQTLTKEKNVLEKAKAALEKEKGALEKEKEKLQDDKTKLVDTHEEKVNKLAGKHEEKLGALEKKNEAMEAQLKEKQTKIEELLLKLEEKVQQPATQQPAVIHQQSQAPLVQQQAPAQPQMSPQMVPVPQMQVPQPQVQMQFQQQQPVVYQQQQQQQVPLFQQQVQQMPQLQQQLPAMVPMQYAQQQQQQPLQPPQQMQPLMNNGQQQQPTMQSMQQLMNNGGGLYDPRYGYK